jgi:hypothetical protein
MCHASGIGKCASFRWVKVGRAGPVQVAFIGRWLPLSQPRLRFDGSAREVRIVMGLGRALIIVPVMLAVAAVAALGGDGTIELAQSNMCKERCFAQEQACLMSKKDSSVCNDQLLRCLASCR